ncbi:MAG: bifunctional oligoribonuclease/PAP phosphatase NrnA [Oscillospiraceae bacterium]|nr:bifunctional oligoribonuclease/PAP phosphatase NrnA [Ruminococcus sp.]MCD8345464.1 bifunctional oligoribonuclease/PAP phosphatase NrnA [Oscillospiraceae bacterium]
MDNIRLTSYDEVAEILKTIDNVTILTHKSPDGDCIGAGMGLCFYLRSLGKKANVLNSDGFPERFDFMTEGYEPQDFEEQFVISVDISDTTLLGDELESYSDKIDLCIDHHGSNRFYAKKTYVDPEASAACLIIFEILEHIGAEISLPIATNLYTGLATDTGCFKFQNTTPEAHIAAAKLMRLGVDFEHINRKMFDIKSRGRVMCEQRLINDMRFFEDGQVAFLTVLNQHINEFQLDRSELDAFANIPLTIEGVRFAYTLKQQEENPEEFKVSLRTTDADAAAICGEFGGGGHLRASGCTIEGKAREVMAKILDVTRKYL